MNHHKRAWKSIQTELLGEVCEVARRTPWGFKSDRKSIHNVTCEKFLKSKKTFGTVILHILLGEGESQEVFQKVLRHSYKHALKIIILEHSPKSHDWIGNKNVTTERMNFLRDSLDSLGERIRTKDLGRNIVYHLTTVKPLFVDQLSDKYIKNHLYRSHTGKQWQYPDGYYTHSSEFPISHEIIKELPEGKDFYWIIGGSMFLANIHKLPGHQHKLIDSVLKQCLYARISLEPDSEDLRCKINTIKDGIADNMINNLQNTPMSNPDGRWKNFYKTFGSKGVLEKINSIEHQNITKLNVSGQIIYTSTVPIKNYNHLKPNNWVITGMEGPARNIPTLIKPPTIEG